MLLKTTKRRLRISYNAPVVLTFVLACLVMTIAGMLTNGESTAAWFCVRMRSLADPMMYVGLLSHVFGHIDLGHFLNNAMLLLLAGPMLEEKYGSRAMVELIMPWLFLRALCIVWFPLTRLFAGRVALCLLSSSWLLLLP